MLLEHGDTNVHVSTLTYFQELNDADFANEYELDPGVPLHVLCSIVLEFLHRNYSKNL